MKGGITQKPTFCTAWQEHARSLLSCCKLLYWMSCWRKQRPNRAESLKDTKKNKWERSYKINSDKFRCSWQRKRDKNKVDVYAIDKRLIYSPVFLFRNWKVFFTIAHHNSNHATNQQCQNIVGNQALPFSFLLANWIYFHVSK